MKKFQISLLEDILKLRQKFNIPDEFYMIFLASIVGIIGAFTLVLYHHFLDYTNEFFYHTFPALFPEFIMDYIPIIIPGIGGLIIASFFLFVDRYEKEYGAPAIMDAVVNFGGYMPKRLPSITFFASILTIATGGSVGKEGPSILIGAGIASALGTYLKLSGDSRRLLVGAGAATGLAAAFNVPIAAAIFALEIIMADFSMRAFSPVVIASVFATTISRMYISDAPIFQIVEYHLNSPYELPLYLILGLGGGFLSVFFIRSYKMTHDYFQKLEIKTFYKPILGGLIVGIMGFYFHEVYGFDNNVINNLIGGNYTILTIALLLVIKIVATNITLASGGIGGLFTPTLIVGAAYGYLFGLAANHIFDFTAPAGAYAVVGMAIMSTGVQHAMLSAIMIIFETTSDYHIMLPLMIGVVPAILISRRMQGDSIYTMQFQFWGDRIARGRNVEILEKMEINDIVNEKCKSIPLNVPLLSIINSFMDSRATTFPVINEKNEVEGIISLKDIREIMFDEAVHSLIIAQDFAQTDFIYLYDDAKVESAFQKFDIGDFEAIPILKSGTRELRGMLSRDDLMRKYRKELLLTGK
jgi:CIC family chloride channel protein